VGVLDEIVINLAVLLGEGSEPWLVVDRCEGDGSIVAVLNSRE
jgi:hypothetical protein